MSIQLEVWGDYALFTLPEMKVERVSYDIMTPDVYKRQVFALYALCAEASLLLLAWYRGQLGVQSKWFFYVFYPAHLLGLWALGLALN